MIIKGIIDEDFINYKKPSMTIEMPYCTFKCDREYGQQVCQNSELAHAPNISISIEKLVNRYLKNPITKAVVFQGLEPLDSFDEVLCFIKELRQSDLNDDDIIIYTGYTEDELKNKYSRYCGIDQDYLTILSNFKNIIIKFGRFNPKKGINFKPLKFDEILGVYLASRNQYAKRIS